MVEKSRRDRVGLGLIGLGPTWEQVYREPLIRLKNRLTIRLVYDSVDARSRSVAAELEAEVAESLWQILNRQTLQGLLVIDPGWYGSSLLDLLARCGKPVFLGIPVLRHVSASGVTRVPKMDSRPLEEPTSNGNGQLIPELGLRFTPSSCRLRELIATRLGRPRNIRIACDLTADVSDIAALVDWCIDIMGNPTDLFVKAANETADSKEIEIEIPPALSSDSRLTQTRRTVVLHHAADFQACRIDVECDRGRATLFDQTRIVWRTATESKDESLTDERTETEILIDQFCRRALGGLNPMGRLSEYMRALEIARLIRSSL